MLVPEYTLRMETQSLNQLEKQRDIHYQAYLNHAVTATEQRGKKEYPKYPTFKKFFDYDKQKEKLLGKNSKKEDKHKNIKQLILIANKKGG